MSVNFDLISGTAKVPRSQWYVIAFSREITRKPLSREILGEPVALFDRCAHRGMPLSNGVARARLSTGGNLGMGMDLDGRS